MIEFEAPDWKALHSSLARRKRFSFCPVGYYLYHVPGRDGYAACSSDWQYKIYAAKHCMHAESWVIALFRESLRKFFRPGADFRKKTLEYWLKRSFEYKFNLLEQGAFRSDPKIVNSVWELNEKIYSAEYFYNKAQLELNNICSCFTAGEIYLRLLKTPVLDFRHEETLWQWQLGGLNFATVPDLVWKENNTLQILDMNCYTMPQEIARQVVLYKVYVRRFMQIAPAAVKVNFFDPVKLEYLSGEDLNEEDFSVIFRSLAGEAAMWRDYLVMQNESARFGKWHYGRWDNCCSCRFKDLCPALKGTPLPEEVSI